MIARLPTGHAPPRRADGPRSPRSTARRSASSAGGASSRTCWAAAGGCSRVGNGGSACQAQHLTSELVGRYRDDRAPFSALALCTETSALTAIGNDYGIEHLFARQVRGHGRAGDVLVALSTSGRSPNVLAAVEAAEEAG